MKQISLVFPNQLFKDTPIANLGCEILMIEDPLFFGNDSYHAISNHKNKLIMLRASMHAYKEYLQSLGNEVIYSRNKSGYSTNDYLKHHLKDNYSILNLINPHDDLILKRIKKYVNEKDMRINILKSPMFLTKEDIKNTFIKNNKKTIMASFYKQQRRSQKILINNDGSPSGGQWSFDELNRKKLPKGIKITSLKKFTHNEFVISAIKSFDDEKIASLGSSKHFLYPTNFEEARLWLRDFLENRFSLFGDYEDAISKDDHFLLHSVLSPMLNVGLLTPKEVIEEAIKYADKNEIPLNSLEGFIRQIIGWREFICLVYEKFGSQMRTSNFWGFERKAMPSSFYDGTTGIEPVDNVISNILKFGYCHHIERLMIIGNFMLLCRIHPDEVYKWFMGMFIDSYDWVMVPNVYGMSQFSDAGIFSTKPYISSSNYIKKMSNFKSGKWCEIWDGLFWKFLKDHETFFRKQYRLAMLMRNLDKMDPNKLNSHIGLANQFLNKLK